MLLAILLSRFVEGKALTENSVIDFGSTNSWIKIDVYNDASQPVAAINAGASQYFYAKARGCNNLAPGASCEIWIKFRPFREESYTGTLSIDTGTSTLRYPMRAIYYTQF
jgi:hypothetical protein